MKFFSKLWRKFIIRYILDNPGECSHEWEVYNVALNDHSLELSCNNCALVGSVYELSDDEWERGLGAPSKPYIWEDESRVIEGKYQLI